ncbi:hypothetical protein SAMN05421738_108120 [Algoriella xinjiangensis]|uniref:HTH cro/C1-type domain-containing protein n=1 Tax=Algoriella xinjiangensis TaxID=684065 RepID=A0A1I4X8T8_9FLAO|nr:hypothetical protein [Algoriella xinjiangensis]SFN21659.1 hypothetical protein SAMN05421738_108120 [Algoriella xinjiangensis]VDH14770.1 Uncharacterised protein [Algoriella xinjiangensis]
MKKSDVPQDKGHLSKDNYNEVYYAINDDGEFSKTLSAGWETKNIVQSETLKVLEERTEAARQKVENGEASPILYFMELKRMDWEILSNYVGIWKFFVKRHAKATVFRKLNDSTLKKYAEAFEISVEELKHFDGKN